MSHASPSLVSFPLTHRSALLFSLYKRELFFFSFLFFFPTITDRRILSIPITLSQRRTHSIYPLTASRTQHPSTPSKLKSAHKQNIVRRKHLNTKPQTQFKTNHNLRPYLTLKIPQSWIMRSSKIPVLALPTILHATHVFQILVVRTPMRNFLATRLILGNCRALLRLRGREEVFGRRLHAGRGVRWNLAQKLTRKQQNRYAQWPRCRES